MMINDDNIKSLIMIISNNVISTFNGYNIN